MTTAPLGLRHAAVAVRARPGVRPAVRAWRGVPGRAATGVGPEPGRAGPPGQGGTRRPAVHPRPPLPAGRGDPVRRRHRRLLQAGPGGGGAAGGGVHRLLRRALHGRVGRHPDRSGAEGDPARPRGGLLDGRHGPVVAGRGRLGRAGRRRRRRRDHPGDLHELLGRHQGLLRPPRWRGLHLVEREVGARLGVPRAGRRCCSCPTSTSAATPPCCSSG